MNAGLVPFAPAVSSQQQIESLQRELYRRNQQLADAEKEIASLRQALTENANDTSVYSSAISNLRTALDPLYSALRRVYGEMESIGTTDAPSAHPHKKAIWDSWKQKLPSGEGKAIDALLLHGSMTTPQLRIHVGCAARTAQNIVKALKSKGLIVKDGGQIKLKEL